MDIYEEKQCRTCLHRQRKLLNISDNIAFMIQDITQLQVTLEDGLSQWVCSSCLKEINRFYEFRKMCLDSIRILKEIKISECLIQKVEPGEEDHMEIDMKFEPFNLKNEDSCSFDADEDEKPLIDITFKSDENFDGKIKTIFSCPYCHAPFTSMKVFNNHLNSIHSEKKSDDVEALIQNSPPLGFIYRKKNACDLYKCFCNSFTGSEYAQLLEHFKTHFGEKPIACSFCEYRCSEVNLLKHHIQIHSQEKPYTCCQCGYSCKNKSALRIHSSIHSTVKNYPCKSCPSVFKSASSLSRHKTATHDNRKNHACHMCEKKFCTFEKLSRHMAVHTGEKPHVCHICGYAFTQVANLKKHILVMHEREEISRRFKCDLCDFTSKHMISLTRHMARHAGVKEYKCDQCPFLTNSSHSLKLHILRHSGKTLFSCDLCDYKCLQRARLKAHRLVHTGEKNFSCDLCSYRGGTQKALKNHKETHSTELKYSCSNCSFKTNVRESLSKHNRKKCQSKRSDSKAIVKNVIPSALIPEVVFDETPKESSL